MPARRRKSSLFLPLLFFFFFQSSINFPKYRKYTFISCKQRGYVSQPRKETLLGCSSNKKNIRNRHIKRSKAYCGYVNHWIWIILKLYGPLMKSSIMCQWQKPWNIFKCTNSFYFKNCPLLTVQRKKTDFKIFSILSYEMRRMKQIRLQFEPRGFFSACTSNENP